MAKEMSMAYSEKQFASEFSKFIKENATLHNLDFSMALELKVKEAPKRLNFKTDFQPQQIPYLVQAQNGCVYKKLSDLDPSLKPFDSVQLCFTPSYAVICWYKPRQYKKVYFISAIVLKDLIDTGVKSITEDEARSHANYIFEF